MLEVVKLLLLLIICSDYEAILLFIYSDVALLFLLSGVVAARLLDVK